MRDWPLEKLLIRRGAGNQGTKKKKLMQGKIVALKRIPVLARVDKKDFK